MILQKKSVINSNHKIKFVIIKEKLENLLLTDNNLINFEVLKEMVARIRKNKIDNNIQIYQYTIDEIEEVLKLGLIKNVMFVNCSWLMKLKGKLIKANKIFNISRGERRGWDPMFYPKEKNSIEKEYIYPVLLNSREAEYTVSNFKEAFCCSSSLEELNELKHYGAINWIKKFEGQVNGTGKPLPEVLAKPNVFWYEMSNSTVADIAISMNPDKRLFFSRLEERGFVNQRLIRMTSKKEDLDIMLQSALLNSILGLFYIEGLGFERGLGA